LHQKGAPQPVAYDIRAIEGGEEGLQRDGVIGNAVAFGAELYGVDLGLARRGRARLASSAASSANSAAKVLAPL